MSYSWTKEQIEIISKNPNVRSFTATGLYLRQDFLERLYKAWSPQKSTQFLKSFFEANGFTSDAIPQKYFYALRSRMKTMYPRWLAGNSPEGASAGSAAERQKQNTPEQKHGALSQYADHPLVTKITGIHYGLTDEFYNDARPLRQQGFSVEQILKVYDIDATLVSAATRRGISQKLAAWKERKVACALSLEQRCRYAMNKAELMEKAIADFFAELRAKIPTMTRVQLREYCRMIEALPVDTRYGYGRKRLIELCGLSSTRYYRILSDDAYIIVQELRNTQDDRDVAKIRQVLERWPFPMGARQICMQLPRVADVSFSLSKIRRLTKKYGIVCNVRRPRNAVRVRKEWVQEHVKPNLVQRKFRLHRPGKVFLSDVTYLNYAHGTRRAYGSSVIDSVSGRLLTFCVSENNDLALGLDTLTKLSDIPKMEKALFHTDQGILYLSDKFQDKVKEMGMNQSMSKRGNCWDNSPQESFFGHFKDEVNFDECDTFEELKGLIERYSDYYNNDRCQWTRNRMPPIEYESYLKSMTDEEFSRYLEKEEEVYEQKREDSAAKAKLRAQTLGPDSGVADTPNNKPEE